MARWAESKEVVKATLSNVQKTVSTIIEAVKDARQAKGMPHREAA